MSNRDQSGAVRGAADHPRKGQPAHSESRRRFMKSVGMSSIAAATSGAGLGQAFADEGAPESATNDAPAEGKTRVTFKINGKMKQIDVTPNVILLDAIRDDLQLTGTKKGCDHGQCGACTIHVNGVAINSCLSLAVMHEGDEITTVEGLGEGDQLHPIQQAFLEEDAYQCGYCTSGQMMSATSILADDRVGTSDEAVREAMSGNICRCGAYKNILAAVQSTRGKV
ncbi:twin-arginine translocation pathway signal [Salinisphaera dokdonensis CL-ES53]|uniref:Twin-arginine translocation pathway signal n=1 Tax=Salinisphaera dokdonensis CL-ES53 TaxID=1304272 RepID=A0ABV2B2S6_9GAMM